MGFHRFFQVKAGLIVQETRSRSSSGPMSAMRPKNQGNGGNWWDIYDIWFSNTVDVINNDYYIFVSVYVILSTWWR